MRKNDFIIPIIIVFFAAIIGIMTSYFIKITNINKEKKEELNTEEITTDIEINIEVGNSLGIITLKENINNDIEEDISTEQHIEPQNLQETTEVIIEETSEETITETTSGNSLGVFTITAYCGCEKCCGIYAENRGDVVTGSIGEPLINNYSIAVDPSVIPYYSTVYINGQPYVAHDTGGAINGNRIDIYFDNHQDALNWGVQYIEVYR